MATEPKIVRRTRDLIWRSRFIHAPRTAYASLSAGALLFFNQWVRDNQDLVDLPVRAAHLPEVIRIRYSLVFRHQDKKKEEKKYEAPPPPARIKRKKKRGAEQSTRIPTGKIASLLQSNLIPVAD